MISIKERLQLIHPKLDFTLCQPKTTEDKIAVKCPVHGEFTKRVLKMLYKPFQGCPKCGFSRRNNDREVTKEQLVARSKELWGDKYDLTNTVINGTKKPITIVCDVHGPVQINMGSFYYRGCGCTLCGVEINKKSRLLDEPELVARIKEKFGDHYDLSRLEYTGLKHPVFIGCPVHGRVKAFASSLLLGQGCNQCGFVQMKQTVQAKKSEEFYHKMKERYGDTYDLTKTIYKNANTDVTIICRKHGPFKVRPFAIMTGKRGRPFCSGKFRCYDSFIAEAEAIHGKGRYEYELFETVKGKFGVTCLICGYKWRPSPRTIMAGSGCPVCAVSGFHPTRPAKVYVLEFTLLTKEIIYKIGITNNSLKSRIQGMKVQAGIKHKVIGELFFDTGTEAFAEEQRLHKRLAKYRYTGERFIGNGWTELFTVNPFTHKTVSRSSCQRYLDKG